MRLPVFRMALAFLLAGACTSARAQQTLIYDDDCSQDVDCVATLPIRACARGPGEVHILAMIADSANPLTAPVLRLFANYAGHRDLIIGANQTAEPDNPNCVKTSAARACGPTRWSSASIRRHSLEIPGLRNDLPPSTRVATRP